MDAIEKTRRITLIGAAIGAAVSLAITLLMDTLYADTLQGTWRDAIARDFSSLFGANLSPDSIVVYIGFIVILAILAGFGALMGAFFGLFIRRFLMFMGTHD